MQRPCRGSLPNQVPARLCCGRDAAEDLRPAQVLERGSDFRTLLDGEQSGDLRAVEQGARREQVVATERNGGGRGFETVFPGTQLDVGGRGRGRREGRRPEGAEPGEPEASVVAQGRRLDTELEDARDRASLRTREDGAAGEGRDALGRTAFRGRRAQAQGVTGGELVAAILGDAESGPVRRVPLQESDGGGGRNRLKAAPEAGIGADPLERALLLIRIPRRKQAQLLTDPFSSDGREPRRGATCQLGRTRLDLEAGESDCEPSEAQHSQRILVEGRGTDGPQPALFEIGEAAVGIDDLAGREIKRDRVDREVPAREIDLDATAFEIPDVDLELRGGDAQRREATGRELDRAAAERGGETIGDLATVPSDDRVEVAQRPIERGVPDRAAHEQHPPPRGGVEQGARRGMAPKSEDASPWRSESRRRSVVVHLLGSRALSMSLDAREVHRVAALARLRLSVEEEGLFAEQLGRVVEHIDRIRELDPAPVAESAVANGFEAADEVAPGLDRELFLANAPASRGPFLVVPKVLGSTDG